MTAGALFQIVSVLISLTQSIIKWLNDRKMIDGALAEQALKSMQDANGAIAQAKAAGEAMRADLARNPDKLREPDKYERKD